MKTYSGIKCTFILVVCFSHASTEKKECFEYKKHRNWPVLQKSSSSCGLTGASVVERIMGGRSAKLAEFPWIAFLTYSSCPALCGGSLITSRHVVTAAHCCNMSALGSTGCTVAGVRLGERDLKTGVDCYRGVCAPEPKVVPVEKFTIHEGFDKTMTTSLHHDICLLTLERNVEFTVFVNPICVPEQCNWKEPDYKTADLKLAGWGLLEQGDLFMCVDPLRTTSVLQSLKVMAIPFPICYASWWNQGHEVKDDMQVCAGMELGQSICKGDSGGPLMHQALDRMVLVGVTSFGQNCSQKDTFLRPGVYTRVSHYIPWILDNM